MKLMDYLIFLFILTLTFDRFLTFSIAGFTLRIGHILIFLYMFIYLCIRSISLKERPFFKKTVFNISMFLYFSVVLVGYFFSLTPTRTIGYFLWGLFDFLIIFFVIIDYCDSEEKLVRIIKWNIIALFLISCYGILQFIGGFLGLSLPFTFAKIGPIVRASAFTYEPSYLGLFLMEILPLTFVFWLDGIAIFKKIKPWHLCAFFSFTMLISTSLLGYVSLISFLICLCAIELIMRNKTNKNAIRLLLALGGFFTITLTLIFIFVPPEMMVLLREAFVYKLIGRESSSGTARYNSFWWAFNIFKEHPLIGTGLGSRLSGGANMWLEILSETGILGFLTIFTPIAILITRLHGAYKSLSVNNSFFKTMVEAYLWTIIWVFFITMQQCQTLWRMDLWVLLAIGVSLIRLGNNQQNKAETTNNPV